MRKFVCLYLTLALISIATPVYAQGQQRPVTIPDLSDKSWTMLEGRTVVFNVSVSDKSALSIFCVSSRYENKTASMTASLLVFGGTEVAMLFSDDGADSDNPKLAVKVDGKWYLAKDRGPRVGRLNLSPVLAGDGVVGVRLTVDTVDGPKEVVLSLK